MRAHLPYLWKIWDRGVDIGVGVVTSMIVASIGLAFWKGKLWLDAQRQRQEHRIKQELDEEQRWADAVRQDLEQRAELAGMIQTAALHLDQTAMAALWDTYIEWLHATKLDRIPENMYTVTALVGWSASIRNTSLAANVDQHRLTLRKRIEETVIPLLQRTALRVSGRNMPNEK